MKRGIFFSIHSIAGLVSGLFILLMSLSGAALVLHEELDSLQYPAIIQEPGKPVLPVDSCYRSLQKNLPHAQVSSCYLAENTGRPFIFSVYDSSFEKGTQTMQVFMHPQTAEILWKRGGGKDGQHNFMAWLTVFHNSFHLKKTGEWLLGFFAVIFVISIITGIILYRKNIVPVLFFKRKLFRRANLHQLIGVYALLFNLMIGITGFWMQRYVFKKEFYAAEQPYTPVIKPSGPLFFNIDSSLKEVQKKHVSFTGYVIYFAPSKQRKTAVYGSRSTNAFIHSKKFADAVFLDSAGGIAKTAFVTEIIPENRRDIINAQLHYGRFGGWGIKLLYVLFGLSGGILSITGFILWLRRNKTRG
ncbi:MAG: PepSY-associated TM helix domain-containing protein [Bacteroidota bacterium]